MRKRVESEGNPHTHDDDGQLVLLVWVWRNDKEKLRIDYSGVCCSNRSIDWEKRLALHATSVEQQQKHQEQRVRVSRPRRLLAEFSLSLTHLRAHSCHLRPLVAMSALRDRLGGLAQRHVHWTPTMDSDPFDRIDRLVLVRQDYSGAGRGSEASRLIRPSPPMRRLVDERLSATNAASPTSRCAFRFWPVVMEPP